MADTLKKEITKEIAQDMILRKRCIIETLRMYFY